MKSRGLSSTQLSFIAAFCMTLDHVAVAMAHDTAFYFPMRMAGRIAFVVFAFLIAHSADMTASPGRFCMRLLLFALLTEPLFDIAFYRSLFFPWHQNVFFTLLLGLLTVFAVRRKSCIGPAVAFCALTMTAQLLCTDYGGIGVLLIAAFAMAKGRYTLLITAAFALATTLSAGGQPFFLASVAAAPFLALYNGERGGSGLGGLRRWFFYLYYPAHIAVIAVLSRA